MSLQWSMVTAPLSESEEITKHLQNGYEPFAVATADVEDVEPLVFFKRQFFSESDEPRSSTKEENQNWAGSQTTE